MVTPNWFVHLQNPFLDELFGSLQALCNIFIVKPENLPQVCSEEPYVRVSVCNSIPACIAVVCVVIIM